MFYIGIAAHANVVPLKARNISHCIPPPRLPSSRSAFVRGCPARGVLGGLSRYTHEVVLLCQVAGYDPVIVETVGLGQNEVRSSEGQG